MSALPPRQTPGYKKPRPAGSPGLTPFGSLSRPGSLAPSAVPPQPDPTTESGEAPRFPAPQTGKMTTKLYVGNLSWSTRAEDLSHYFSQWG